MINNKDLLKELELKLEMENDLLGGYLYRVEQLKNTIEEIGEDEELFNTMLEYRSRAINSIKKIANYENKIKELKR